jgi:hypothetical protein
MTTTPEPPTARPLCVDLDGTLTRSDVLTEAIFLLLGKHPLALFLFPIWLLRGKAYFKARIAERIQVDPALLPYHGEFLEWLQHERQRGRRIFLVTAAHEGLALPVARHVGIFEGVMASGSSGNLAGPHKAARLTREFGPQGFDYAGNSRVDLPVWAAAGQAIVVNARAGVVERAKARARVARVFSGHRRLSDYARALRAHRWFENLLVLVPLIAAHRMTEAALLRRAALAFAAFSLCTSGINLLSDLLDLAADRRHETRRKRPLAAGKLPIQHGALLIPACLIAAFAISALLPLSFVAVLGCYLLVTFVYPLLLKRAARASVIVLAALYTLRIVGGGEATGVPVPFSLLGLSMLLFLILFLGLALMKRSR